ncbi:hypothetical protein C8R46DRAFT_1281524, partial [Mycena filopes]
EEFVATLVASLAAITAEHWKLEVWTPDETLKKNLPRVYEALSNLGIPKLHGKPSLLVHQLGEARDPEMIERIQNIFKEQYRVFLVNTSGSGKTRQVIEGLCREWGFYFVSTVGDDRLGSGDFETCLRTRLILTDGFTENLPKDGFVAQLVTNEAIALACFSQVLLARVLIFQAFLKSITKTRRITADDKRRWVLIQMYPSLLVDTKGTTHDCFNVLAGKLNKVGLNGPQCDTLIKALLQDISGYLKTHDGAGANNSSFRLFCVLDEAQFAANCLTGAFRSNKSPDTPRPALRPMIDCLDVFVKSQDVHMGLTVAGTGVDQDIVTMTMNSTIQKDFRFELTSLTGSFGRDTRQLQMDYVTRYIPAHLLVAGRQLVKRCMHWLEGRRVKLNSLFRFTASFLTHLLQSDFRDPHRFLDSWVHYHTTFWPSDSIESTKRSTPVRHSASNVLHTSTHRLELATGLMDLLMTIVYQSFIRSNITATIVAEEDRLFVECGFARYTDGVGLTYCIQEPMLLLAATQYAHTQHLSINRYIFRRIEDQKGSENNGLENFLAYFFAKTFATPTALQDAFSYHGPMPIPSWFNQRAQLVVLGQTDDNTLVTHDVRWMESGKSSALPAGRLGRTASGPEEALRWLRHRTKTAICFPPTNMGPDLLFVLKLEDGSLIWVAVQVKFHSKAGRDIRPALRTTVPDKFWLNQNGGAFSPGAFPTLVEETLTELGNLNSGGNTRLKEKGFMGHYPLLRVVAAFPMEEAL